MGKVLKCTSNPQTKFSYMRLHPSACQLCIDFDEKRIYDKRTRQIYFEGMSVFYQHNQQIVSKTVLKGVVDELLCGSNCLILAYGGRGCGKTFSCFGLDTEYEDRGIAFHLLEELFSTKTIKEKSAEIMFEMSFMEFKQNCAIDLLSRETLLDLKRHKMINISSAHSALQLIFAGVANRDKRVVKNCDSHYNSAVLTIRMHYRSLMRQSPVIITSVVQIVDLAAVEIGKNNIKTAILMENINGNIAMMQISYVIDSLKKNENTILSYRSPLITHLKGTLGRHCLMKFLGHSLVTIYDMPMLKTICRISIKLMHQPRSFLKYNVEKDPQLTMKNLEDQVKSLMQQMLRNEIILQQEQEIFTNNERMEQMKLKIEEFLRDQHSDLGLLSFTKARIAINMFKELIKKLESENNELKHKLEEVMTKQDATERSPSKTSRTSQMSRSTKVGNVLIGKGITVGDSEGRKNRKKSLALAKLAQPPVSFEPEEFNQAEREFLKPQFEELSLDNLDYSNNEQVQEKIKAFMITVQREYLQALVNLRQAQAELLILKQSLKHEPAKDELLLPRTVLTESANTIKIHEERVKEFESLLLNFETSINHTSQMAERVTLQKPEHYLKVYKPSGQASRQDTQCKNEYELCKELYLRDRRK